MCENINKLFVYRIFLNNPVWRNIFFYICKKTNFVDKKKKVEESRLSKSIIEFVDIKGFKQCLLLILNIKHVFNTLTNNCLDNMLIKLF